MSRQRPVRNIQFDFAVVKFYPCIFTVASFSKESRFEAVQVNHIPVFTGRPGSGRMRMRLFLSIRQHSSSKRLTTFLS